MTDENYQELTGNPEEFVNLSEEIFSGNPVSSVKAHSAKLLSALASHIPGFVEFVV